jgi:hypothetical protein
MYEWLEQEIEEIATNKFHRVDGPADAKLRQAVQRSKQPAPASYKEFVLWFGNAELYRYDRLDLHYVTVYAALRETETKDGERLWMVGRNDRHFAYFKDEMQDGEKESPVIEWIYPSCYHSETAYGYQAWIEDLCRLARKQYGKRPWAEIEAGPPSFTPWLQQIVVARRRYRWLTVGVAFNGDLEFAV